MCPVAGIDAPGSSKLEGATGDAIQEGGFQKEALLIICIGVILSFSIFLGYKKRKRA